jgi:hypothetical protein
MSDQAGQAPGTPASGPIPSTPSKPEQTLTLDLVKQIAKDEGDRAFRSAQGLYEKGRQGFEKQVQSNLDDLKRSLNQLGVEITPEREQALRTQAVEKAIASPVGEVEPETPQGNEPGAAPPQAPEPQTTQDPILAGAVRMMDEAGIKIEDGDPEITMLDNIDPDKPYELYSKLGEAIQAKKTRLEKSPEETPPSSPGIITDTKSVSPFAGKKGIDLLSEAYSKPS